MKCKNVKKFRKCIVKPFKHTCDMTADKCQHIIGKEMIIVDLCDKREYVYVKEDLKNIHFFQIHRKDLRNKK